MGWGWGTCQFWERALDMLDQQKSKNFEAAEASRMGCSILLNGARIMCTSCDIMVPNRKEKPALENIFLIPRWKFCWQAVCHMCAVFVVVGVGVVVVDVVVVLVVVVVPLRI